MKTLLICPSKRPAVPHFSKSGPLAITIILGECLIGHWIEYLAALGATQVMVIAAEGHDQVREAVGDGARWGVNIDVVASSVEPTKAEAAAQYHREGEPGWLQGPHDIIPMLHLPDSPDLPLFESYSSWFAALKAWMPRALTPSRVRVTERRPGVWVGSRSRVSPLAKLIAPCWIGDLVFVEAGAVIGPGAILEDRTVVARKAKVTQSWIGPDTFVGTMTSVANSLAKGSLLIDWQTDSSLRVPDPFLLSSLANPLATATTDRFGRSTRTRDTRESQPILVKGLGGTLGQASPLKVRP